VPTHALLASFREWVESCPNSPALSWRDHRFSYGELHALAESAAEELRAGLPDGAAVCVVGASPPALVATVLGAIAGHRRVLLTAADLDPAMRRRIAVGAGCRGVVTAGSPTVGQVVATVENLAAAGDGPGAAGDGPGVAGDGPGAAGAAAAAGPGLLLTTSGSTGLPKIVPLAPAGVDRFVEWAAGEFGIGAGTVVLNYAPLNFDLCLLDVWTTLARGGEVLPVARDQATDGRHLMGLAARAEVVQGVPMLFRLIADAAPPGWCSTTVREVLLTGDLTPPDLVRRVRELFPAAALSNVYGCTETNDSFLHRLAHPGDPAADPDDSGDSGDSGPALPIGRPIPGVRAAVVDDTGAVLDGPATGELLVSTPFQCDGYLDRRLNRDRFVPAPPGLPGGVYYRTGDLVRRAADGVVTLLGRADFQVKVRGVRTNLQEVEAVILRHAAVLEAAVVAVPDQLAGNRLHAVVRRSPDAELNGLQLRSHCAAALPRTAVPGRVEITDQPLPRTSTGKIDRTLIRQSRTEEI
jgi:acyl-coenzyme A synthetase/AMP-(fatty) acid ligase